LIPGESTSSCTTRRFPFEEAKCNGVSIFSVVALTFALHDIKYCSIDASALIDEKKVKKKIVAAKKHNKKFVEYVYLFFISQSSV